jgi:hypothetical protein
MSDDNITITLSKSQWEMVAEALRKDIGQISDRKWGRVKEANEINREGISSKANLLRYAAVSDNMTQEELFSLYMVISPFTSDANKGPYRQQLDYWGTPKGRSELRKESLAIYVDPHKVSAA